LRWWLAAFNSSDDLLAGASAAPVASNIFEKSGLSIAMVTPVPVLGHARMRRERLPVSAMTLSSF
jgi:hypothetical protein